LPFIFAAVIVNTPVIYLDVLPVIRGSQILEIGSRDPGHAHLGVILWSTRRRGPSSTSAPNLKRIALFVQKL